MDSLRAVIARSRRALPEEEACQGPATDELGASSAYTGTDWDPLDGLHDHVGPSGTNDQSNKR